jgi:hypothetical protein
MRRGSLLLIGIATAVATIITLNVTLGRSWNYYDGYGRRCYHHGERYRDGGDKNNQRNKDNSHSDSSTGKY